jgi:hypothetical protein
LWGALRKAGVPVSGASFRTFESSDGMRDECSRKFGR